MITSIWTAKCDLYPIRNGGLTKPLLNVVSSMSTDISHKTMNELLLIYISR